MTKMKERIELQKSGIIFNENEHTYYDPLSERFLSGITQAIQNQIAREEYVDVPENVMKEAAERGTKCHSSIEAFTTKWIDDGSLAVASFKNLCRKHELKSECAEYTVTDYKNYASNIDCVFRVDEDTFDLADIKTVLSVNGTALLKATFQLSIYAMMFEIVNPKAKVRKLYVLHIRETEKEHISELIEVRRIPSDVCKDLLQCELEGRQFTNNPLAIPNDIVDMEERIRTLMTTKAEIEKELTSIKSSILDRMESTGVKTWATETMRLTVKSAFERTTFNLKRFQADHPGLNYEAYQKITPIASSLQITI